MNLTKDQDYDTDKQYLCPYNSATRATNTDRDDT